MGKLLPVSGSATPYRYVSDNLEAVRAEFIAEAKRLKVGGVEVLWRLRRLLTAYEVLSGLRDGFVANGWFDGFSAENEPRGTK